MERFLNLRKKKFAVYGLGATGKSVINYFNKKKIRNYSVWDDNKILRKNFKSKTHDFEKSLNNQDFIVVSPGINIKKSKFKKKLIKFKKKIITDLDLFYLINPNVKTIVVTGTNGKSTTCKILEHLLKKNKKKVKVGGNIGKPILDLNISKNSVVIIEASSFHLALSQYVKPNYGIILNLSRDHIDWHGNMNNYLESKLRIFKNQKRQNYAFLKNSNLIKKFRSKKFLGKLIKVSPQPYNKIKENIQNKYLNTKINEENMSFAYELSKRFNIKKDSFIKSFKSFKGLPHRHEIFYKKDKIKFINDSKATTFEASKYALKANNNILWITGGLPKTGDKFYLNKVKKNIIKAYIIGKNTKFFEKQLSNKIQFKITKTLKNSLELIFKYIKKIQKKREITVLLSPSSASYDQYKNFNQRGNHFKKLVKFYAKKYL